MFSINPITESSFPVALIKKSEGSGKTKEVIFYTEPTRKNKTQKVPFEKQIEQYLEEHDDHSFRLKDSYSFEMLPTISEDGTNPRFINFYLSASNSGKSYQIAALCKRYLEMFPDNLIAYASANPIANDVNYEGIRDKIKEIDVLNLDSQIDFAKEEYRNSLWIFDDCDSGFSASLQDLDSRLTPEELDNMTVTDKQKALNMLKKKIEVASTWINASIQSFMMNGRKMSQSVCVVSHKPFEGRNENKIINEASGVILFPASIRKNVLEDFIVKKLSFQKGEAREILYDLEWMRYDFLYLSHRTSVPFIITQDLIKIFP